MKVQEVPDIPGAASGFEFAQEHVFFATEAMADGDIAVIDFSVTTLGIGAHVRKSTAAVNGGGRVAGGVVGTANTGGPVTVRTAGIQANVRLNAAVTVNAQLSVDSGVANQLFAYPGSTNAECVAVCAVVPVAGRGTVMWKTGVGGNIL